MTDKPHWSPDTPTRPGRYFYRDPRDKDDYGICLVAWSRGAAHGSYVQQPSLRVHALCIFSSTYDIGENSDHPSWSYSIRPEEGTLVFWTEPLATPDFPEISGQPPNIAPAVIQKEKAKSVAQAKASKKRERERARQRKQAVAKAVSGGSDLYQCEDCDSIVSPEDRVVGKMRGCPHCSTEFVETEGRACPDCHRPFTSLVEEKQTCPECLDGGELPDLVVVVEGGVVQ